MYGIPKRERKERIEAMLKDLELLDKKDERARNLSGGMKRRLMIAKAMLHKPKLLILDEPTAGVDVSLRQKIWELVRRVNAQGTAILFTTHYLEEAEQLCEAITLINHGKVIKQGKLSEIQKEFSKNAIHFELFDQNVPLLEGVHKVGTEYELVIKNLAEDMDRVIAHYGSNLKSIRNESASLEQIFLELTA
jgi:ABC-2 type transport system ATP-binding protein